MATMIPGDVESFATEGERQFYRFLEQVALPDDQFTAWYTPDIEGREPDFILFDQKSGLTIFEVKDWALEQIRGANQDRFTLRTNNGNVDRKNPIRQAREYSYHVMDRIEMDRYQTTEDRRLRTERTEV